MVIKNINENISYIECSENPLSADVGIIKDNGLLWLYDVGNNEDVIKQLPDKYNVVISHFHQDHFGNINKIGINELYVSKESYKHCCFGNIVEDDLYIGNMHIFKLPSSHCKGCLGLEVGDYAFTGDGLYSKVDESYRIYNVQFLKQQIDILKSLKAKYLLLSHEKGLVKDKQEMIAELEKIYKLRSKDSPYIQIKR